MEAHTSLTTQVGPRRVPAYNDETEFAHEWKGRPSPWKRAVWVAPLVVVTAAAVAMAVRDRRVPVTDSGVYGQVIKVITFEHGSLTDVTTGVGIVRREVRLEPDAAIKGLYSAHVSGGSSYLEESLPGTTDLYISLYIRLMELPAGGDLRLVHLSSDRTALGNIILRDGRLRLRNDKKPVGADSFPIVPGQTYRIGLHQRAGTGSNGVLEAFVAAGDAPFGAPFATTFTGTWTDGADRVRFGMTSGIGVNALIDDVRLHADEMPQPSE